MNNSNGIFKVGFCYYHGIGVEMNKRKAFEHYLKSAEMDNSIGIFKTAICYYYGIEVEKSNSKFNEWIRK
jgi:TPR repeat protein